MLPEIYRKHAYPEAVIAVIEESGQTGIEIANRWMLGWPQRVKALLEADEYLAAFQYQLEVERAAYASAFDMSHLAPREIAELYGLSMEPPTSS